MNKLSSDIKIEALAPKDDLSAEKDPVFNVYNDSLNSAFENPKIRNLALSGSLGSGKSSIIRSFDRKRNGKNRFLYISLIDFSKEPTDTEVEPYDQRQLEYSLLNQILSYCTSDDLPEGSICGIPEKYKSLDLYAKSLTLLFLSSFVLIFHEKFGALAAIIGIPGYLRYIIHLILYMFVIIVLCGCVYRILSRCLPFLQVSKLLLKTNVAEAEVNLGKERTTLDTYKFELAYILEQIGEKHDYTVVFEDLERLDPGIAVDIMGKLRELNTLTNNHLQTQVQSVFHPIRFLYAISDSTMHAEYRTKFYDCIIPVVPVSHPLNSREQFKKMLEELGLDSEWKDKLCDALSDAFADYRTLLSLRNEFLIFRALYRAVSGTKSAQCTNASIESSASCNEAFLFAITAYKILLPEWFEYTLSPQGDGILPNFSSDQEKNDLEEYLTKHKRTKVIAAVQKMFADNLLDKASMRLIIGERALIEQWMKIIRSTLDRDTFDKDDEARITKVIEALASVLKNTTLDPTQEPYSDFMKAMTERLCKLTSEKQETHFILVINSLSAVSGKYVANDWPWTIYKQLHTSSDFGGFLRNYLCWLVDLSRLQEPQDRVDTINNIKDLCKAYPECQIIAQEYADRLFEQLYNQMVSDLSITTSRLNILCEAIPEYQGVALKHAKRLSQQSHAQRLPKRIDTISRLKVLCEAYQGNKAIAQEYATALLKVSYAQQGLERSKTIIQLKRLCNVYPESKEIVLAYAKGLFNLKKDQEKTVILDAVEEISTFLQAHPVAIRGFKKHLSAHIRKHPNHAELYQPLLELEDSPVTASC